MIARKEWSAGLRRESIDKKVVEKLFVLIELSLEFLKNKTRHYKHFIYGMVHILRDTLGGGGVFPNVKKLV